MIFFGGLFDNDEIVLVILEVVDVGCKEGVFMN